MKSIVTRIIICILPGIIFASILSILGHYDVWLFTNSIRTNLFIVGLIYFIISFFSYQSTNEEDRRITVYSSISKYARPDYEGFNNKIYNLLIFALIGVLFGAMYLLLPEIRI